MYVADMHCDTIAEIHYTQHKAEPLKLEKSELNIDLEKLRRGGYLLQNFALFVHLGRTGEPYKYCLALADTFAREMERCRDSIVQVRNCSEIESARAAGKLAALLTVEEGESCEGDPDKLAELYRRGARMMTLTWNFENSLAFPNAKPLPDGGYHAVYETENGLKPKGVEIAREMERLHMIIDVSHLSDKGFWDVCEHTRAPFAASHSNARALCSHPRNLTDEMIKALADRGGVTGLNYFGSFLEDDNPDKHSRIEAMVRHAKYIAKTGGVGCLGLGSDFDGISGELELYDCSQLPRLADALLAGGFTEDEVERIFYKNVLRLYKEVLG